MDIVIVVVSSIGMGMLCSIPGIVVGRLLARRGVVREGPVWLIAVVVSVVLALRLAYPHIPLGWLLGMLAVLSPVGMYRQDLWTYLRRGRLPADKR